MRLLPKADGLWEGRQAWGKWNRPAKVLAVQAVKSMGDVVAVGTETNTLIVEGLYSHNSKLEPVLGGWVTGEHRLSEYFTKHENGYIKIGEDFFKTTVDKNRINTAQSRRSFLRSYTIKRSGASLRIYGSSTVYDSTALMKDTKS